MGLISFIKDAGKSIFGNKEEEERIERELQKKEKLQREELDKLKKARGLERRIKAQGLEIENLAAKYDNGHVILRGQAKTQADSEKAALTAGNILGVVSVDNQLEVTNPEPEAQFHTVESGDTLSGIAKKYYGNGGKYPVIFEANKPMLEDPDKIYPGQVLRIPALDS